MKAVTHLMGDPQLTFPVIQVAGTNGKSSTARMIESLLRSFGLRTGLYTSPHLVDPTERICLDGAPISPEAAVATWNDIEPFISMVDHNSVTDGGPKLSYFEAMTALAYSVFADSPVDVAIIEVGLGGTWDATSVCRPQVAVITPIDLDHQEYLGETIREIAGEKAGILANADAAVLGPQSPEAAAILIQACANADLQPTRFAVEYGVNSQALAVGGQLLSLHGLRGDYSEIFLPLFGEHQGNNAAVALAACETFLGSALLAPLDEDLVREGFANVISPGRLEILRTSPTIMVDAAHNPHSAKSLATALETSFTFVGVIAVVGMLHSKDAVGFLEALSPVVSQVVITEPISPRALPAVELARLASEVLGGERVTIGGDLASALEEAIGLADSSGEYGGVGVIVTGSVVLVGETIRLLSDPDSQGVN
ncbi:MAG: bifunctional folylpolyglutamate synthase/dihydrofolate synthase [Actinobacteria bacterium]|jgi:dihydrofolate synthase / folylpolyglutamate synthase|nr:bifunctional folylpolyglutamate synthase/dihydrofolate synthase [Actinomycetota bacterium]MBT5182604.1 bifunctional folylpolyglutamate synthase/dihydrofolate synthase [Actinomycetota bacterium]MBT5500695.1 bifunctional folylpolyglutamate synthase/dihydrofolate synthase [Actinomycetota bacterium]